MTRLIQALLAWLARRFPPAPRPPPVTPPVPPPADMDEQVRRLYAAQDRARVGAGLAPLRVDARLAEAAIVQARDCAATNHLDHRGVDGSWPWDRTRAAGYPGRNISENAAQQPGPSLNWGGDPRSPEWAVDGWMQSPGHRANLLGPYADTGAAYADSADGTRYFIAVYGNTPLAAPLRAEGDVPPEDSP
jgi:uncharacterized protein YkwD